MAALELLDTWPVERAAGAIVRPGHPTDVHGEVHHPFGLASLSKPMAAWALMVAVEEGIVELDAPVADAVTMPVPDGATLRHLLSHAAGFPFDGAAIAEIERTRTYSNTGIELAAEVLERAAAMPFATYLSEAVFQPLGMSATELRGSPAHGVVSTVSDTARFVDEMLEPALLAPSTHHEITTAQYPTLAGIVPGVGKFDPCPWGLGVEIHGEKSPHWMAPSNSAGAFGHFGGAGTMMWADPDARVGTVALTDRPFDQWAADALRLWPEYSTEVLAERL